jgi:predicted secreted protein
MKSRALGLILFLIAAVSFCGDIAHFQNLGFSPDSRYFMFGQYGIDEQTTYPYADLFLVHVPKNSFVPKGVQHARHTQPAQPGYNGEGALLNLLGDSLFLKKEYAIDHTRTGRLLYVLVDGEEPLAELQFRDFQSERSYKITLVQNAQGIGREVKSAFHILLTVQETGGAARSFVVGLPEFFRPGVKRYRIAHAVLAPDERSVIFIVQKEEINQSGSDIRFMVETVDTGA